MRACAPERRSVGEQLSVATAGRMGNPAVVGAWALGAPGRSRVDRPMPAPPGVDATAWAAAQEACAQYAPTPPTS